MLIVNKTDLSYEEIGKLIDDIIKQNKGKKYDDKVKTAIYKFDWFNVIQVDVYYLKKYTKIVIWNRSKNNKEGEIK